MKCPKCGYLGLDEPSRCRNCGFDFSLTEPYARVGNPGSIDVSDLSIRSTGGAGEPLPALPLYDDTPLIVRPSAPRAPLAVRRSTPDLPRSRTVAPRTATLELDLGAPDDAVSPQRRPAQPERSAQPRLRAGSQEDTQKDAGVSLRLIAAAVDSCILLAIDVLVIYFTMQICAVSMSELDLLPKVPLVAFLCVQNIGYLLAFTAGGQTLGKMAAGLRIVPIDSGEPLNMNCALKRTVASLVLAVPAGLGLLSACFSHDHRGLHDRFAGTRVVRAM